MVALTDYLSSLIGSAIGVFIVIFVIFLVLAFLYFTIRNFFRKRKAKKITQKEVFRNAKESEEDFEEASSFMDTRGRREFRRDGYGRNGRDRGRGGKFREPRRYEEDYTDDAYEDEDDYAHERNKGRRIEKGRSDSSVQRNSLDRERIPLSESRYSSRDDYDDEEDSGAVELHKPSDL